MTISTTNQINNRGINSALGNKNNKPASRFFIDDIEQEHQREEAPSIDIDPIANMEKMTGKTANCNPSYVVTDDEAKYFREKYGEDYDEEQPYQIFYELAEKKIISSDDACNASEYGRLIFVFCDVANLDEFNKQVRSGAAKECFSDYTCYGRCYERFKGEYDKEISTWQDVAQQQLDFYQYLIDLDEELLTPDGTHFQSSKEQMNVSFRKTCASIMKVKDVLSQIFG